MGNASFANSTAAGQSRFQEQLQIRKALAHAIKVLGSDGDVLLVTRLDRLARSTRDLLNILDTISKAGAKFRTLASRHHKLRRALEADGPEGHASRLLRQTTQLERTKISAQWYRSRHDEPPAFAMLNQTLRASGNCPRKRVKFQGPGIRLDSALRGNEVTSAGRGIARFFGQPAAGDLAARWC